MRCTIRTFALLLAVGSCTLPGCSTFKQSSTKTSSEKTWWAPNTWFEEEYQSAGEIAVIWSPDVLSTTGQAATRGFGGRVFFYNASHQAIPVEGDLIIHGYSRKQSSGNAPQAEKSFDFPAEKLTTHFSPSELGASYSIWVPWDQEGGLREPITLVATFKNSDGKVIQGTPAKLFLPGKNPTAGEKKHPNPMQQVSYRSSSMPTNLAYQTPLQTSGVRTTTIGVPAKSSLGKRSSYTLGGSPASGSQSVSLNQQRPAATSVSVGGKNTGLPTAGLPTGMPALPGTPATNSIQPGLSPQLPSLSPQTIQGVQLSPSPKSASSPQLTPRSPQIRPLAQPPVRRQPMQRSNIATSQGQSAVRPASFQR